MKILYLGFFFCISTFFLVSETLMVDTVSNLPFTELDDNGNRMIRNMENGIIDSCFEMGWMVFNSLSVEQEIEDNPDGPFRDAGRVSADYLIRIQALPEERKMYYIIYSVSDKVMLSSGEWVSGVLGDQLSSDLASWFYESGKKTLEKIAVK